MVKLLSNYTREEKSEIVVSSNFFRIPTFRQTILKTTSASPDKLIHRPFFGELKLRQTESNHTCNSPLADCPRVMGGRSAPARPTRSYSELSLLSSLSLSISSPTRPLSSPRHHGGAPIAPFPFGASTLAGASSEVVVAELHRLAIIFFPEIEVSPKFFFLYFKDKVKPELKFPQDRSTPTCGTSL